MTSSSSGLRPACETTQVRGLLNGERAALRAVPGAKALRLGQPPVPDLPIWLGASGERTIGIATELADGWYPLFLRRDRVRELRTEIRRPLTVAAGPVTVVDPDPVTARAAAAAAQGHGAEVELVRSTRTVPADAQALLEEFTAYGDAETVQKQLAEWDATADVTMVGLPPGLPWPQIEATLRAAAPDPL
jgi:5,10-methylenetetrahydromethanopterin reductase